MERRSGTNHSQTWKDLPYDSYSNKNGTDKHVCNISQSGNEKKIDFLRSMETTLSQKPLNANALENTPDVYNGESTEWPDYLVISSRFRCGRLHPRRLPMHQKAVADQEIVKMLKTDTIEPSISPWAAPKVLVKKRDGTT